MELHKIQTTEQVVGQESGWKKENSSLHSEGTTSREIDKKLGLCSYEDMIQKINAPRSENLAAEQDSPAHRSKKKQTSPMETTSVEGERRTHIDLESEKIYENAGIDMEKHDTEKLADQEYEIYKLKDVDPSLEGPDGKTNAERMERGLAPYVLRDGKLVKVELHHHDQKGNGPLIEIDSDTHGEQGAVLHPHDGPGEGRGFDPHWDQKRSDHWQIRSKEGVQ